MSKIVPENVTLAAKRGFVRTTAQGYAATLSGGIAVSGILAVVNGEIDYVTVAVTIGVALVSPLAAGLASYLSITSNGIPKDYLAESDPLPEVSQAIATCDLPVSAAREALRKTLEESRSTYIDSENGQQ